MIEPRLTLFPCFQQILKERPQVIASQIQHAWDMPENTFGGAYAKFMGDRNFSPDDRPQVRFLESEELAYVAQRAREVLRYA
jgi:ubiquinone biosynthesis protein COQ4